MPVLVAELLVEGARWPVYAHVIDHPDGRVLVDTGLTELHPAVADLDPRLVPWSTESIDVAGIDNVVNTHLHFDHCGGNRLFPGIPIHVQRRELADARTMDDYTIPEWVDFSGATYVEHDGEVEILPGVRLIPAAGHTAGHQVVVVETDEGPVVLGGDVGYSFAEVGAADTEGKRLVLDLAAPTYLAHVEEPRVPRRNA